MDDRISLYPGRVKLTPVSGQEDTYDLVRADSPTQEGTPLNKATLLKDTTAALYGLGADAVPDEVFKKIKESFPDIVFAAGGNMVIKKITTSTTWKAPKVIGQKFRVYAVGGGGGGGAGRSGIECGGGGGGGGYITIQDLVIPDGTDVDVICGAGGKAGSGADTNKYTDATDGGTTYFGSYLSAAGGKHGNNWSSDASESVNGGDGGAGGGGGGNGAARSGRGGNGGTYGGGGGNGTTDNYPASPSGSGGTYGGGGGCSGVGTGSYDIEAGTGGLYGGSGGGWINGTYIAAQDGTSPAFTEIEKLGSVLTEDGKGGARYSGGSLGGAGGGGYGGNGGTAGQRAGGGGGGYGGNGGNGGAAITSGGGGGGNYGGNGGNGTTYSGGGGGGLFADGGTNDNSYYGGGGAGITNVNDQYRTSDGSSGGCYIVYFKED